MAKPAEKPTAPVTSLYRLTRRYWDGFQTFEAGDLLRFVEGTAPASAEKVSEQLLPEMAAGPAVSEEADD